MRRTFRDADFSALTELWNSFYASEFALDPDILKLNTVESRVFDWGASFFEMADDGRATGLLVMKRSANPLLYGGSEMDLAHLSAIAFRNAQTAVDLFAESKRVLRDRGVATIRFGQDSRHFFPGCPANCSSLCSFLMVEGFEPVGDAYDVQRDLKDYEPPGDMPADAVIRPLESRDLEALDSLLTREFSPRWHFDVMRKTRAEGPECVVGLFLRDRLVGFALIQHGKVREPVGGAVWRKSLGAHWGSLGPIGVAARVRGKGYGNALLSGALTVLKGAGVRQCLIDWTTLLDFYGKHGFKQSRQYHQLNLKLD